MVVDQLKSYEMEEKALRDQSKFSKRWDERKYRSKIPEFYISHWENFLYTVLNCLFSLRRSNVGSMFSDRFGLQSIYQKRKQV